MANVGRKSLFYLLVLLLLVGVVYAFSDKQEVAKVGAIAPNFQLENLDGAKVELKEVYRQNQLTLINFWATWCPPCRVEIPELTRFYRDYRAKGVEILAVNIWDNSSREALRTFAAAAEMIFPVLVDQEEKIANAYRIMAVPTTFFLDRQGRIKEIYTGAMTYRQIQTLVERYLAPEN